MGFMSGIDARYISNIATSFAGQGTERAKQYVTASTLLDWVKMLFGKPLSSAAKVTDYDAFAALFADAVDTGQHTFIFKGYTVTFIQPQPNHDATARVTVTIEKNDDKATAEVAQDTFKRVTTAMRIRKRAGLPLDVAPLTDEGRINLKGVRLQDLVLTDCPLDNVDLRGTELIRVSLHNVTLREGLLHQTKFDTVVLRQVDFSRADMRDAHIVGESLLSNCLFTETKMDGFCIESSTVINDFVITPQQFVLFSPSSDFRQVDLSHLENNVLPPSKHTPLMLLSGQTKSALTVDGLECIKRISHAKYPRLTMRLVHDYTMYLSQASASDEMILRTLSAFWQSPYISDRTLTAVTTDIANNLRQIFLDRFMPVMLPTLSENVLAQAISLYRDPKLRFSRHWHFIQLILQGANASNPALKKCAWQIYDDYLSQIKIPIGSKTTFDNEERVQDRQEQQLWLLAVTEPNIRMALSQQTLMSVLNPVANKPMPMQLFIYALPNETPRKISQLYDPQLFSILNTHFPYLSKPFSDAARINGFHSLLEKLCMGELKAILLSAALQPKRYPMLLSSNKKATLWPIFRATLQLHDNIITEELAWQKLKQEGCLSKTFSLQVAHFHDIEQIYGFASIKDTREKALLLICLAAIFIYYGSDKMFGHANQPCKTFILYACGLLKQAYDINAMAFSGHRNASSAFMAGYRGGADKEALLFDLWFVGLFQDINVAGPYASYYLQHVLPQRAAVSYDYIAAEMVAHVNYQHGHLVSTMIPRAWLKTLEIGIERLPGSTLAVKPLRPWHNNFAADPLI